MSETPGGNEKLPPTPNGDERPDGKPGYPPPGQRELEASIAQAEIQDKVAQGDLDAILLELESGTETPEARKTRLSQFVETHFADICPPNKRGLAVKECLGFEDDCRNFFEEPDLKLGEDDVSDPELRQKLEKLANSTVVETDNDESIAAVAANNEKIETGQSKISTEQARTPALTARAESREAKEREVDSDLATVEQLQAGFNRLKAEKGTIGALQTLLEPDRLKSPEMKAKVESAVATAQALVNAIPGKSEVVTRILDQSNINFAASSPIQIFAGFLAEADKSNELTDDEKAQIRRIIGQSEKDFQTGSDAQKIARAKEQIIDPETGKVIGEKYVHDSPENMAELRPNLGTYMDGERMMLATKDGLITRDVTGWSGEDIGLLAEALELHSFAEKAGITGMVESIGNIHFNTIHDAAFDRAKIIEIRQVMSALVGMGKGYDGDVFDPQKRRLLLMAQMRVLTDNNEALEWNNDEAGTTQIIEDMGLKTDGQPNFEVIKAFGSYIQENMSATRQNVQAHLHKLFPDLVAPPKDDDDQEPQKAA